MASSSSSMKGFYKEKKKPAASNKKSSSSAAAKNSATLGSGVIQPPALISHGGSPDLSDEYDKKEEILRQFDLNMAYGPCLGMTRLARWERASKLGMNPPCDVERLLKLPQAQLECLWEGRV